MEDGGGCDGWCVNGLSMCSSEQRQLSCVSQAVSVQMGEECRREAGVEQRMLVIFIRVCEVSRCCAFLESVRQTVSFIVDITQLSRRTQRRHVLSRSSSMGGTMASCPRQEFNDQQCPTMHGADDGAWITVVSLTDTSRECVCSSLSERERNDVDDPTIVLFGL